MTGFELWTAVVGNNHLATFATGTFNAKVATNVNVKGIASTTCVK